MSYQVLARKWRPKKFSDVVGQNDIVQAIIQSFKLNKIHHAYVLSGTRGVGKTTIARLFAKGLNCNFGITSNVCGQCKNCQDIELGYFIDLFEIDAASRTKVEDTREFLDDIQYMPARGRFKVYLIDEAHMLSRYSFNALLKMLEEPPAHVKFILITTEPHKIPETILSRCVQFFFKPLSISHIESQLKYIFNQENITVSKTALESLAYMSKGSMRDALNLSEQAIVLGNSNITPDIIDRMFGIVHIDHPLSIIENLIDGNIHIIMKQINNFSVFGINWDFLLNEILVILQKIAVGQFLSSTFEKQDNQIGVTAFKRMREISKNVTPENIQLYYQIFLLGRQELPYAPNHRMGVEMTILRALAFCPIQSIIIKKNQKENGSSSSMAQDIYSDNNIIKKINEDKLMDTDTEIELINKNKKNCDTEHIKKIEYNNKNPVLCLDVKTSSSNIRCDQTDTLRPTLGDDINSNTAIALLTARGKLLQHQKYNQIHTVKTIAYSEKQFKNNLNNILKRFLTAKNLNISDNSAHHIQKKINSNLPEQLDSNTTKKITDSTDKIQNNIDIIHDVLLQAVKKDKWLLQIYRLLLPKPVKELMLHSWKEEINSNLIRLHLRSHYKNLNSATLNSIIQTALSNEIGRRIKLDIVEDDDSTINTPIEHIYILYKQKVNQEFLDDPYVKMIESFFDATIDENDTSVL